MLEMNKVMLIGNLTRDPELSYIQNGAALAKFGLAVNRSFKNKQTGEWQEDTAFVELSAWRHTAEFCGKYLHKGTRVYVEGSLRFHSWDAQDGTKRSRLDVTVERVEFVLSKTQQDAQSGDYQQQGGGGYQQPQQGGGGYQQQPPQGGSYAAPPGQPPAPPAPPAPPSGGGFPPPQYGDQPPMAPPPDNTADDLPF